jgi:uncharacterized protein
MRITFDPAKRQATLRSRRVDFADAGVVFEGPVFTFPDERLDHPEERCITVGLLAARMVIVVWTPTEDGRRDISMRKANAREQALNNPHLARSKRGLRQSLHARRRGPALTRLKISN